MENDLQKQDIEQQIRQLKALLPKKDRKPRKLPVFPTYEEYQKFLSALKKEKADKRYILAIVLAFEAGLRLSEIVGFKHKGREIKPLSIQNINLIDKTIKIVSGKGQKDRVVPLPRSIDEKALSLLPIQVPRTTLQDFVSRKTKAILGKRLSIHKFRHGFGSRLASQNLPVHVIQMWMGHSRIDTTGIYLHASPSKEEVEKVRDLF